MNIESKAEKIILNIILHNFKFNTELDEDKRTQIILSPIFSTLFKKLKSSLENDIASLDSVSNTNNIYYIEDNADIMLSLHKNLKTVSYFTESKFNEKVEIIKLLASPYSIKDETINELLRLF